MSKIFENSFEYKLIYVFAISDMAHKGLLKIGDATIQTDNPIDTLAPNSRLLNQAAKKRIDQYTKTAAVSYQILHTELAIRTVKSKTGMPEIKAFRDHDVHRVLMNSGFKKKEFGDAKGREWFELDLATALKAIEAVKKGRPNLSHADATEEYSPIIFRPEQENAIKQTLKQFKTGSRMLWNAKMRFGKTLCALQVVRKSEFSKTIIITHRPIVDDGWYKDFKNIFYDRDDYEYGSRNNGVTVEYLLKSGKKFVYFVSMQDLRGSSIVGGKFDKNDIIFTTDWDCVVVDEAHEGTTTSLGEDVIKYVVKENNSLDTKFLALSGTPFNILSEYEDNIYTWDYVMEQQNKHEWDNVHFGDSNPYDELPELRIYTYDLGKIIMDKRYVELEDKAFNFREFFRVWTGDIRSDRVQIPDGCAVGDFYHANDVKSFLNLITKSDEDSQYPYATEEYRSLFKHSLWMVPGVREAKALSKMMKAHPVFGSGVFDIVNVAGDGDEEEKLEDALKKVQSAIETAGENYTITLSCGKLTTGVTVPEWTAVFMLAGSFSTSASNYLQTIFRVQSPCNKNGMIKRCCYVFDFAPDRTLKMVAEAVALSTKAGKASESDKRIMGEFLNYCPVIAVDGTMMKPYDTNRLLQQLKRAYAERAVKNGFDDINLYSDELLKLDGVALEEFQNLKEIVGASKAAPKSNDIDINDQGFTDEEYEELGQITKKPKNQRTPEEEERLNELKEKKKQKNDAISILRGISIRMPLLIYGADIAFDEEFTIDKFLDDKIVDSASWDEFMPIGVTKQVFKRFMKYYDAEIFIAAGRRIRNTVKSADEMLPIERIQKITELFACFKNPDKETVLTPWRVVNMHMADCLGGYDFYDEKHNLLIEFPRYVNHGQVTSDTLSNSNARILEINSKTGLYPLYVTYSIFSSKCKAYAEEGLTFKLQEQLWNTTVENNVFVICKTPMAKSIVRRTLLGYKDGVVNAHYFDDLINYIANKPNKFVDRVLKASYWKKEGVKMKFDAVVGNPPYQIMNKGDGNGSDPIYHLFINAARLVCSKGTFIHPARFLFNAGKTPKDWNKKMLNDEHYRIVRYWANSSDVFPSVDIKGGVAVSYWDENQQFEKIGTFTVHPELHSIMKKVVTNNFRSFADLIYPRDLYRLSDKLYEENEWATDRPSKGHKYDVGSNVFDTFPELFTDEKPDGDKYAQIIGRTRNKRYLKWVKTDYLRVPDNFKNYKVFVAKANGSGLLGESLSMPIVGKPNMGHTVTFLSIGKFDTKAEAEATLKYIKTKFARIMLSTLKVTQDNPRETWLNVPSQDFTLSSDIDWTLSVKDIDVQLYKKYKLSDEEIAFIEDKAQIME